MSPMVSMHLRDLFGIHSTGQAARDSTRVARGPAGCDPGDTLLALCHDQATAINGKFVLERTALSDGDLRPTVDARLNATCSYMPAASAFVARSCDTVRWRGVRLVTTSPVRAAVSRSKNR